MIMAYWNDITWECNANVISYMESLTTSFNMDTQNNADKEGKSPTEEVGLTPIEISFSTTYRIETGTQDIRGLMSMWKSMIGAAAPLIIGDEVFGADMMQLQSVSFSDINIRHDGVIRSVTVSFKLKEFVEEVSTTSESGETSTTTATSAITVGPTTREKAKKKTYSDIKAEQIRDR